MPKLSVLIPSRNERYLQATISDILKNSTEDIEVIAVLDGGDWPDPPIIEDDRVIVIRRPESLGMRAAITSAVAVSSGTHIMKTDAHCLFGEGFDSILRADCEDDWIVVPRRYALDVVNWGILDNGKAAVDAHFLSYPYEKPDELGMHGNVWRERAKTRLDVLLDDEMASQGSCWYTTRKHFDRIGGMPEEGYGKFVQENQQLFLKTWLSGGRCVINKATYYAHWFKGRANGRGYFISKRSMIAGTHWSADYWLKNRWPDRKYDLEWLIEKFAPVPTWPSDWLDHVNDYQLGPDGLLSRVRT